LDALGRYDLVTVCAGPKSILDASATLERLESRGVGVVGYGTAKLAGFLVPETELPVPATVDSPSAAAAVLQAQRDLGLAGGVLLCKPVSTGLTAAEFAALRSRAEAELASARVAGRDSTPFLLTALARLSGGRSVEVNARLLEENASLAAQVAAALGSGRAGWSEGTETNTRKAAT